MILETEGSILRLSEQARMVTVQVIKGLTEERFEVLR